MGLKDLLFDYYMRISYAEPVGECHYTIRCIPAETDRQRPGQMEMEILPEDNHTLGEDSFGNRLIMGRVDADHDSFLFHNMLSDFFIIMVNICYKHIATNSCI